MIMCRNRKAQGISMNVVILAAIAVMVLLLVGTFMSGGFKALTGKISSFVSGSTKADLAAAQVACGDACSQFKSGGCKYSDFTIVRRDCSSTALTGWNALGAYKDIRDGRTYESTCKTVVGGVGPNDCAAPTSTPATLDTAGDYIEYEIVGAGGSCSCKRTYGQSSGWGS